MAPLDVLFSRFDVVEPDLLYMSHARHASIATPQNLQGAPELAIEIASPGTRKRDRTIKRDLYERFGVNEYWIVEPDYRGVEIYRTVNGRFGPPIALSLDSGDVLTTPLFPDLALALSGIFRA
jgi:Uma2 family endonuclease